MSTLEQFLSESMVALKQLAPAYNDEPGFISGLRRLACRLDWGDHDSSAFARIIPEGSRVMVKPNFVLDHNQGPWTFDAVITHPSTVRSIVSELLKTRASQISVGDAPVQGCDFDRLLQRTGLGEWAKDLMQREPRFTGIHDFRRTASVFKDGVRYAVENRIPESRYSLFDLGVDSLLEPVTSTQPRFRITCYDPKFLAQTHRSGRHQYLISKDVLEADVVINLPKLKIHCKAGITNALKNLVGINGNKEYLPHHRFGGTAEAGDCYPGKDPVKALAEKLYDFRNSSNSVLRSKFVRQAVKPLNAVLKVRGEDTSLEGAWSGNDTVWRMTLDLNRILVYGRPDGTMADNPQRRVLHLCDGIIAGQGRGPLSPQPFELGVILAGDNPAAVDWVGAHLLNFDPEKIPLLTGVFDNYRWPIASFPASAVSVIADQRPYSAAAVRAALALPTPEHVPSGWSSAIRKEAGGINTISFDEVSAESFDG